MGVYWPASAAATSRSLWWISVPLTLARTGSSARAGAAAAQTSASAARAAEAAKRRAGARRPAVRRGVMGDPWEASIHACPRTAGLVTQLPWLCNGMGKPRTTNKQDKREARGRNPLVAQVID